MQPNYRGLAFLLSLGSLPLACNTNKDDTDSNSGGTTTGGTDPTATDPTTGTGTDATDPTQASVSESDSTTTGASATTTTTQSDTGVTEVPTTAEDDTGPPAPTDPICIAYGEHYQGCFPPRYGVYADVLAANCEYLKSYGMVDGQPCIDALDAFFVCLTMTDCAEITAEDSTACKTENDALIGACPALTGDTGTGTDTDGSSTGG